MNYKTKRILKSVTITAIMAALYFVFSTTLKLPTLVGHISLDLGYIVLTVASVCLGCWQAALVGAIGCGIESALLSDYGFAISWFVMNLIIGAICGLILPRLKTKKTQWIGFLVIIMAVGWGAAAKLLIECNLYSIPFLVKLPKCLMAWVIDSIVMCAAYPVALIIKKRVIFFKE